MRTRVLGNDLEVSAVGYGAMGLTHAYGQALEDADGMRALEQALDAGYTFFDTAECYVGQRADGVMAYNEELVGQAIRPYRNHVQLATKCGVQHSPEGMLVMDSSPKTIRAAIDGSLKRLQTDHVELYYQHRIDPMVEPEEVAGVMADLIKEGKILHWGISEATEEYLRRAHAVCPVTCVQNRLSMMARWHESLFPVLEELNIGFVAFSPLANGFLTDAFRKGETFEEGDFRNKMPQYQDEAYETNRELLEMIRSLAREKQATPAQIALAWMMNKKPYIVPIPGSRKTERIRENAFAADILLTAEEIAGIDERLDRMETSGVFGGSPVKKSSPFSSQKNS